MGWGGGGLKKRVRKRKKEKRKKREEKEKRDQIEKKDRQEWTGPVPSGASGELSRAEPSRVAAKLGVGWLGPDQGLRREGEKEREKRGLAAWVVQMGGTRHK